MILCGCGILRGRFELRSLTFWLLSATCILPFLLEKRWILTHLTLEKHNHSYTVTILRVFYFWDFCLPCHFVFFNIYLFDLL